MTCEQCNMLISVGNSKRFCSQKCTATYAGLQNKGVKQTKEHIEKMRQAKFIKNGMAICPSCKEEFSKYQVTSVYCSKKDCQRASLKARYEQEKIDDPTGALARRMTGTIRLPNKKKIVKSMLDNAIDNPCEYCGTILTILNSSLDHKEPRNHAKVYNRQTKVREYSYEELLVIDSPTNLHIVCKDCNQLKSDMNNEQFIIFLKFINKYPDIGRLLKKRLNFARGRWQFVQHSRKS